MQQGYALIASAMSMDGFLQFSGVAIADGAFIKQEVEKLIKKKP